MNARDVWFVNAGAALAWLVADTLVMMRPIEAIYAAIWLLVSICCCVRYRARLNLH